MNRVASLPWSMAIAAIAVVAFLAAGCQAASPPRAAPERAGGEEAAAAPSSPAPASAGDDPAASLSGPYAELLSEMDCDMRLDRETRTALSRHYFEAGLACYEAIDYEGARRNFRQSYEVDRGNEEARERLERTEFLLGIREPSIRAVADLMQDERSVAIQQRRFEVAQAFDAGQAHLAARRYDRAIEAFTRVLEMLRWYPELEPAVEMRDLARQAEARIAEIEATRRTARR